MTTGGNGQYSQAIIDSMALMFGAGFLSPGGEAEVARILGDIDIKGGEALEVGCGLGGNTVALARNHASRRVLGTDIEESVLAHARALAAGAGLAERIEFRRVAPGPFALDDDSFDLVFAKAMICHIADKRPFYAEILRVLRPGAWFAGADWLTGPHGMTGGGGRRAYEAWRDQLESTGLEFHFTPAEDMAGDLEALGFEAVELVDRRDWAAPDAHGDHARITGPAREPLLAALGEEGYAGLVQRTECRIEALEQGALTYCHFRASKPARAA